MAAIHTIPTRTVTGTFDTKVETDHVFVTPSGHRLGIGGVARGCEGRQEFQGPMVPGPWAFAYGLCTVIDNHGGTGAEMRRLAAARKVHYVQTGDLAVIDDVVYRCRIYRRQYIALDKVETTCKLRPAGKPHNGKPVRFAYHPQGTYQVLFEGGHYVVKLALKGSTSYTEVFRHRLLSVCRTVLSTVVAEKSWEG